MNKIMSECKPAMHYVCTRERGRALVRAYTRFFVSNCGCREKRGGCGLCLDACPLNCIEMVPRR